MRSLYASQTCDYCISFFRAPPPIVLFNSPLNLFAFYVISLLFIPTMLFKNSAFSGIHVLLAHLDFFFLVYLRNVTIACESNVGSARARTFKMKLRILQGWSESMNNWYPLNFAYPLPKKNNFLVFSPSSRIFLNLQKQFYVNVPAAVFSKLILSVRVIRGFPNSRTN